MWGTGIFGIGAGMVGDRDGIICRFRAGRRIYVEANLPEALATITDHIEKGCAVEQLISWDKYGLTEESTWPHLVKEVLRSFSAFPGDVRSREERLGAARRVLRAMSIPAATAKDAWLAASTALLQDIDLLSGWTHSPMRPGPHGQSVWRENAKYYAVIEGKKHEILGLRTEEEERWDFVADDCTKSYGAVHSLIKLAALSNICREYRSYSSGFPEHVAVMLPGESDPAFLHWQWNIPWLHGLRRIVWRPENVYCDPEWLIASVITGFSARGFARDKFEMDQPFQYQMSEPGVDYESTFRKFSGQLEIALDTHLTFGNGEESWFEFEGLTLRWINQTNALHTILIIPHRGNGDYEYDLAMRFISKQAFELDSGITVISSIGSARRFSPILRQPKRSPVEIYPDGFQKTLKKQMVRSDCTARKDLALAFYREALGSGSIYYGFLSFYKVVQLAFHENRIRIAEWIETNVDKLNSFGLREWLSEIRKEHTDVTKYLYESDRCAIAHVGEKGRVANPDNRLDRRRISRDLPIIRELARHAIESGLFDESSLSRPD